MVATTTQTGPTDLDSIFKMIEQMFEHNSALYKRRLQKQQKRVEKSQTALRTIANMSAVLQDPEKCGEILSEINNIANEAIPEAE